MQKSSSADARRVAFRAAAVLFAGTTIFVTVLFVRALGDNEIRTGLATYGLFTGAAAVGLWLRRRWGRGLALVIAMGNMGLGTLALLSVIMLRRGNAAGPAILLASSVLLGYLLSRRIFSLPDE
ncbi:MAG TPA: hypothetical protein VFA34_16845 [Actinomycetota bacterium]|nr:hypothetical protein [Actinomycetota bacterium]